MSGRSVEISKIIAQAILDRRLLPGAKVGERELGEALGVSRIVVRQALIRLADDGLITLERNRGAFVTRPGLPEMLQTFEAITFIEQGVVGNLIGRISAAGLQDLRGHVQLEREAEETGDARRHDDLGVAFHMLLVKLGRNKVLEDIHAGLVRRTLLFQALYRRDYDHASQVDDHERLVSLIETKHAKRAQDLLAEHLRLVVRSFVLEETTHRDISVAEALKPYTGTAAA